jgi:hypothetical protein
MVYYTCLFLSLFVLTSSLNIENRVSLKTSKTPLNEFVFQFVSHSSFKFWDHNGDELMTLRKFEEKIKSNLNDSHGHRRRHHHVSSISSDELAQFESAFEVDENGKVDINSFTTGLRSIAQRQTQISDSLRDAVIETLSNAVYEFVADGRKSWALGQLGNKFTAFSRETNYSVPDKTELTNAYFAATDGQKIDFQKEHLVKLISTQFDTL